MKPRLLDLFCCQGGASKGYVDAGFDVVGVDIDPQPRYPYKFVQADAVEYLAEHGHKFDAIHASPPCQDYTNAQRLQGNRHPRLVDPIRLILKGMRHPVWVIENVPGSPLRDPVELCGAMFGLGTYRHRLFEASFDLPQPLHPAHTVKTTKMGRKPKPGEFMHVVGNFSGVAEARVAMGIDWMSRDGLRESIPPAYSEWVGLQMLGVLGEVKDVAV